MNSTESEQTVGVLGARGFIGSAIVGRLETRGTSVVELPRLDESDADAWRDLTQMVRSVDAVVNAAGMASPYGRDREMHYVNTELPLRLAEVCLDGSTRFVHLSSAAVQAAHHRLDETKAHAPNSHYGETKASAEAGLFDLQADGSSRIVIHRPTSVIGAGRPIVESIKRFVSLPFVPIVGSGDEPIPLCHVTDVAEAAVFLAVEDHDIELCLHPWEGATQRDLFELLGDRRPVATGKFIRTALLAALRPAGRMPFPSWIGPTAARVETLVGAKEIVADELHRAGHRRDAALPTIVERLRSNSL